METKPSEGKIAQLRKYLADRCHSVVMGDLVYAYLYGTGSIVQGREAGTYEVTSELKTKIDDMTRPIDYGDIVFDKTRGGHYLIFSVVVSNANKSHTWQAVKLTFDIERGRFCLDMRCRWQDRFIKFTDNDTFIRIRKSRFNGKLNQIKARCEEVVEHMKAMDQLARELSAF